MSADHVAAATGAAIELGGRTVPLHLGDPSAERTIVFRGKT